HPVRFDPRTAALVGRATDDVIAGTSRLVRQRGDPGLVLGGAGVDLVRGDGIAAHAVLERLARGGEHDVVAAGGEVTVLVDADGARRLAVADAGVDEAVAGVAGLG